MKRSRLLALAVFGLFTVGSLVAYGAAAKKAALPLVIYDEAGRANLPYIPSGYIGNTGAIKMDAACPVKPHAGKTCLKVNYAAGNKWGGVVWQSPPNDWGDKPGGFNLTGAKKLTFWARGDKGGEVVSFSYGLIGKNKTYHDTGTGKLDNVTLTNQWKEYAIPLTGKNLSDIKTGFCWTLAATGKPVTFYLDNIEYQ